jgi:GST-like protein
VGGIGPFFGQLGFFAIRSAEKAPLAIARFTEESERLLRVLDRQLQNNAYLAGENYSIADVAAYPWMFAATTFLGSVLGPTIEAMPAVKRWMTGVGEREAVKRGMAVPKV